MAPEVEPMFPEDIERLITEMLLDNGVEMWGTMSLVAMRFRAWTKHRILRTVVVALRDDWTKRISELFLPNANLIRILAIDLPSTRGRLSNEQSTLIRRLLRASDGVQHLGISWHLWEDFSSECGRLKIESLYLIWDGAYGVPPLTLDNLQHPLTLKDITMYAPPDLKGPGSALWFFLPETITEDCPNLAFLTYAVSEQPIDIDCFGSDLEGVMWVLVDTPTKRLDTVNMDMLWMGKYDCPNYSSRYLSFSSQVLGEWLAKMEGRRSVLEHPPPRAVDEVYSTTKCDIMDW
ncbi:hypothetical protein DFH06DRAFT_1303013 [Mycena polygramma]|nr:hypothetical protein DFH06DRAFT_1303013 [Mycena polygramma]